jgi:hypothetical protein
MMRRAAQVRRGRQEVRPMGAIAGIVLLALYILFFVLIGVGVSSG